MRSRSELLPVAAALVAGVLAASGLAAPAEAAPMSPTGTGTSRSCSPQGYAVGYSDALDKVSVDGVQVGGLSALAYDPVRSAWAAPVDNHDTDPSRVWFVRNLLAPRIVGEPLVLTDPSGTPYTGETADDEGLAVLPDGRFVVSSEREPSIRVFGRDGVQQQALTVPARFAVTGTTPEGEATENATLEGLTLTPNGRHLIAAMEGALSGDVGTDGDATMHRIQTYDRRPGRFGRADQLAYRAEPGLRIAEVAAYGRRGLLVLEAAYDPAVGNTIKIFAVDDWTAGRDVSGVANLSARPGLALRKHLVADLVTCPTLGAPTKETQANPLLDNFEAMAVTASLRTHGHTWLGVAVLSDDNFSENQTTRMLNLVVRVP